MALLRPRPRRPHVIERVLGMREYDGERFYEIKWQDYRCTTWEPIYVLKNSRLINTYHDLMDLEASETLEFETRPLETIQTTSGHYITVLPNTGKFFIKFYIKIKEGLETIKMVSITYGPTCTKEAEYRIDHGRRHIVCFEQEPNGSFTICNRVHY